MDRELMTVCLDALPEIRTYFSTENEDIEFHNALVRIWDIIHRANKYIDATRPWTLRKEGKTDRLATVLYHTVESMRITAILLSPFMPATVLRLWRQLGLEQRLPFADQRFRDIQPWGQFPPGTKVNPSATLFPRIERTEKETPSMEKPEEHLIDFSDFEKMDLRIAEIISAVRVEGTKKLMKMEVDIGGERRQIVAGIADQYAPENVVGKKIVLVANLKPATIRGIESRGMLLAATEGDSLSLVTLDRDLRPGAKVR
jgi:methionyl-tRNA synthetase